MFFFFSFSLLALDFSAYFSVCIYLSRASFECCLMFRASEREAAVTLWSLQHHEIFIAFLLSTMSAWFLMNVCVCVSVSALHIFFSCCFELQHLFIYTKGGLTVTSLFCRFCGRVNIKWVSCIFLICRNGATIQVIPVECYNFLHTHELKLYAVIGKADATIMMLNI